MSEDQKQKILEAANGDFTNNVAAQSTRSGKLAAIAETLAAVKGHFKRSAANAESLLAEATALAERWRAYVDELLPPDPPPPQRIQTSTWSRHREDEMQMNEENQRKRERKAVCVAFFAAAGIVVGAFGRCAMAWRRFKDGCSWAWR